MNFLKNIITKLQKGHVSITLKENSKDYVKKSVEPSTCTARHSGYSAEETMSHGDDDVFEGNNNTIGNEIPTDTSKVQINVAEKEDAKNISNYKETLINLDEFADFRDNNNESEQNDTLQSEIDLTLAEKDDTDIDIIDFNQFLNEFKIKRNNKLPKCVNIGDSIDNAALCVVNEELVNDIDDLFATIIDPDGIGLANDTKSVLDENNALLMNKKQLIHSRLLRKPNNEAPVDNFDTNIDFTKIEQAKVKPTNVENFPTQPDNLQTFAPNKEQSVINTSNFIDLITEEDNTLEIEELQNGSQGNKIKKMQDVSVYDYTDDVQSELDDNTKTTSNENIKDRKEKKMYKEETDNIATGTTIKDINESNDKDTISLLSIETDIDLDFCNGYHSSDFEFITESDAETDGLINKCDEINNKSKIKHDAASNIASNIIKPGSSKQNVLNDDKHHHLGAGNSYNIFTNNQKYNAENYKQYYTQNPVQNHVVPQGEDYLNLFRGWYAPMYSEILFLENKSVRAQTCMNAQYEGIGFDLRMPCREESDEECKYEVLFTKMYHTFTHSSIAS